MSQINGFMFLSILASGYSFRWKDCGGPSAKVVFRNISLTPEPLKMGDLGRFGAELLLKEPILPNSRGKLEMWRLMKFVGIPFNLKLGCLGNCDASLCNSFANDDTVCNWFKQANATCGCPLDAGTYSAHDYMVKIPSFNQLFAFIAQGVYRIRWEWFDPNGLSFACIYADLDLMF